MKTNKQEHEEYEIPETTAPDCNRKACADDVTPENSTSEACCQHGERTSHTDSPTSEKEDTEEDKRYRLRRKIVSVVSFAVLIAFFAVVTITVGKPLIEKLEDPDGFRRWVDGHHLWGRLAFIGMTILQVVVAVIPGEPMEIGAGYAFGAWEGMFLCLVGVALGSAIIYAFTRLLGVRMVEAFISREKAELPELYSKPSETESDYLHSFSDSRHSKGCAHLFYWVDPHETSCVSRSFAGGTDSLCNQLHLGRGCIRIPKLYYGDCCLCCNRCP